MSSKTRIVVLHMKEIIYTAIFAVLAIVLILLLIFMFLPKVRGSHNKTAKYNPGVYTSDLTVGDTTLSLEVTVSETEITSIHFSNLNETVSASIHYFNRQLRRLPTRSSPTSLSMISSTQKSPIIPLRQS